MWCDITHTKGREGRGGEGRGEFHYIAAKSEWRYYSIGHTLLEAGMLSLWFYTAKQAHIDFKYASLYTSDPRLL